MSRPAAKQRLRMSFSPSWRLSLLPLKQRLRMSLSPSSRLSLLPLKQQLRMLSAPSFQPLSRGSCMKYFSLLLPLLLAACVTTGGEGNETNLDEAARTNTSLAMEYARKGNYDLAMEKAKRALSQNDRYAPAHSTLALLYSQRGDDAEAIKHYRRAISLDSSDLFTRNNYAIFECERGRTKEALELFESVARDKSYNAPDAALINAGVCANRANMVDRAEQYFRQALEFNSANAEALLQLASLASKKEDWLKVRAFIQRRDRVAKPSAESLRLAIKAERNLGDQDAVNKLTQQMQREFP